MPVLVDGNNLLFAAQAAEDPERPVGRSMLCRTLGDWVRLCGERVHVIFDGPAPARDLAAQIGDAEIQVSYSGAGVSADTVLIQVLETDSAARRLLVVSSDREVTCAARRRRAKIVASREFWVMLKRALSRPLPEPMEPAEKESGLSPGEADVWLQEFGFDEVCRPRTSQNRGTRKNGS
ncbi:MAG: NYN domain-containing protein [Planctomycetes bacterium]|nr:NYN domain-containing protein [Planctomycetota bacterium]